MSHEVESMMFVGATPWHELGTALDNPPTVAEAICAAGLDWSVGLKPLVTMDTPQVVVPAYATYRTTDNAILGIVGEDYRPLQNAKAFAWFQPFLDAGQAGLHTAGSLRGGKRVWVLAQLNRDPIDVAPGDPVRKFILLSHAHDGTMSIRVGFTPIRVVCANTLAAAHGDKASRFLRVRHTEGAEQALEAIRDAMNAADAEFSATAEQYRALARREINRADVRKYVRQVLGAPEKEEDISTRMRNQVDEIIRLTEQGKGNAAPSVRGTVWAAYNGVTEWLAYQRGRNQSNRLDSLWFGDSARMNKAAMELALAMAV